jgi:uncharacterized protein
MQNRVSRIIIDTNLWISFLITKDFAKLDEILFSRHGILIFSQELLDEFLEVVRRPKFRRFFSGTEIVELLETIDDICRDSKDNFLLSLSVDGNADFLLTGDKDLLELAKFGETRIITISDFLKDR